MDLKYINNGKYIDEIEKLYLKSFPEDERFPFWILEECSKKNDPDLLPLLIIIDLLECVILLIAIKHIILCI